MMAQLLHFPNKMLLEVFSFVDHEEIEVFTSCCKRHNRVGRDFRSRHFERKHNYSTIICGDIFGDGTPTTHPLQTIKDMIKDEVLFSYPTKLVLLRCSGDYAFGNLMHWQNKDLRHIYGKIVKDIEKPMPEVLTRSPYFGNEAVRQDLDRILSGAIEPIAALFLTILPNLESIEMRLYTTSRRFDVEEMVRDVAEMYKSQPGMRHALPRLSTVAVRGGETEDGVNVWHPK